MEGFPLVSLAGKLKTGTHAHIMLLNFLVLPLLRHPLGGALVALEQQQVLS